MIFKGSSSSRYMNFLTNAIENKFYRVSYSAFESRYAQGKHSSVDIVPKYKNKTIYHLK